VFLRNTTVSSFSANNVSFSLLDQEYTHNSELISFRKILFNEEGCFIGTNPTLEKVIQVIILAEEIDRKI